MRIVLIGAGNVGHHLGLKLHGAGQEVVQVFSRKRLRAKDLAKKISAKATTSLHQISEEADLYLLAVNDDGIAEVSQKLVEVGLSEKLMAHTSGATPMTVFESAGAKRFGVFYPLQTFSKNRQADFSKIPICVEANSEADYFLLKNLAEKLSPNVHRISDEQRSVLHVAAVFANNFSNHLYHIAGDILAKNDMPLDLLIPLIRETVAKLDDGSPAEMQTGPARRGDEATIQRHLNFLKKHPDYAKVYKILTDGIKSS